MLSSLLKNSKDDWHNKIWCRNTFDLGSKLWDIFPNECKAIKTLENFKTKMRSKIWVKIG